MTDTTRTADDVLTGLDTINPKTHPPLPGGPHNRMVAARQAAESAEAELRAAVAEAREAGYSWSMVAAALDVSRQAAWERFGS